MRARCASVNSLSSSSPAHNRLPYEPINTSNVEFISIHVAQSDSRRSDPSVTSTIWDMFHARQLPTPPQTASGSRNSCHSRLRQSAAVPRLVVWVIPCSALPTPTLFAWMGKKMWRDAVREPRISLLASAFVCNKLLCYGRQKGGSKTGLGNAVNCTCVWPAAERASKQPSDDTGTTNFKNFRRDVIF